MTNPHGYFVNEREELLLEDEDLTKMSKKTYNKTHKDINRDFPYLVKSDFCMESIGARVVNELFLKHKFSLSLSLHGGTESLTYPYGVPNHMNNNDLIPMEYEKVNKSQKLIGLSNDESIKIAKKYIDDKDDVSFMLESSRNKNSSNHSPDHSAIATVTEAANNHINEIKGYETGDMNTVVYPVKGGMEDWAYSASWEGNPIINTPCTPKTYNEYPADRTTYDEEKIDGMRSIMFLLEVSNSKNPSSNQLGAQNVDCLLNLRNHAFFNSVTPHKNECLTKGIDGYIPKIIRLGLTLIDFLEPYINFNAKVSDSIDIRWQVGGAIDVDETFILWSTNVHDKSELELILTSDENSTVKLNSIKRILNHHSKPTQGNAIWNKDFKGEFFNHQFPRKNLTFVIVAAVDSFMSSTPIEESDPQVPPQTHFVNLRSDEEYSIGTEEEGLYLRGAKYFFSEIGNIDLSKKK